MRRSWNWTIWSGFGIALLAAFSYIPFYVYEGGSKYRAGSTNYFAQQTATHSPYGNLPNVALAPAKQSGIESSDRAQVCAKVSAKITK